MAHSHSMTAMLISIGAGGGNIQNSYSLAHGIVKDGGAPEVSLFASTDRLYECMLPLEHSGGVKPAHGEDQAPRRRRGRTNRRERVAHLHSKGNELSYVPPLAKSCT